MSFKDIVARDVRNIFLNTEEFAERRTVIYDGVEYRDIPIILKEPTQEPRERPSDDHVQGLHIVTDTLRCALEDLRGKLPKQGKALEIAPREGERLPQEYYIVKSTSRMGMLHLELEAMAQ